MYYLGVDIGGMSIKVGVVNSDYKIVAKCSNETIVPCTADEFCDNVETTINEALQLANVSIKNIKQIGVGCPGSIDNEQGVIEYAANLNFKNFPLKELLEKRFENIPVLLGNDANAAAFGEYKAGSLKGTRHAMAITLGTGVGGGIIIDGKIYTGFNFSAGELGHSVIKIDGRACTCGRKGCFEAYSSATGLIKTTKEYMEKDKTSNMWELVEGDIEKVSGRTSFDAMRNGDISAKKVVDEYIQYLACGIANMINAFQPEIICIGGGICNEGETLLAPLRELCEKESFFCSKRTKVVRATLGNDAGIIGAAVLEN